MFVFQQIFTPFNTFHTNVRPNESQGRSSQLYQLGSIKLPTCELGQSRTRWHEVPPMLVGPCLDNGTWHIQWHHQEAEAGAHVTKTLRLHAAGVPHHGLALLWRTLQLHVVQRVVTNASTQFLLISVTQSFECFQVSKTAYAKVSALSTGTCRVRFYLKRIKLKWQALPAVPSLC